MNPFGNEIWWQQKANIIKLLSRKSEPNIGGQNKQILKVNTVNCFPLFGLYSTDR
jgi:hypothetical protein